MEWLTHEELDEYDRKILKKICKLQDKYLEKLPKKMNNRTLGMLLEENMDILRELSCRKIPDPSYIREKTCKMLDDLHRLGFVDVPKCKEYVRV
ncbi:MAG TPA: hypothetical protein ENG63_06270 [Candidatus Desulfofervidus auxilii]|uniref:Uncharacterized protein n=1 Tax=Desulfofervidus auxilii TaxID=1621989 RepID=A0A7C0Y334_DESA2|nr:hypothetical protein [Candidatus Desulfofervidus auxilii]